MEAKKKRVAIVGAGPSGLVTCKHLLARGFHPVVFDAGAAVGGVWTRTLASTRLQTPAAPYRFSDFPWSEDVDAASFPRHDQVAAYLAAYARRFGVMERVRLGCTVVGATEREVATWERWSGNGEAFGDGTGEWHLTVRHDDSNGEPPSTQLLSRFQKQGIHSPRLARLMCSILLQRWLLTKLTETYLKAHVPMQKHGMVPDHSFARSSLGWRIGILPEGFYDKVDQGIIELRKCSSFSFCTDGLVLDQEGDVVGADVVVLATGFDTDAPLRRLFTSSPSWFRDIVVDAASPDVLPLYRQCVHPRIPQLAVVGHAESEASIYPYEMMAKWVAHLLDGAVRLPGSVAGMERDVAEWTRWRAWARRSGGGFFFKPCIHAVTIWYHDQLCRDMGHRARWKKGLLAEWLQPYGPADYADIQ
ncbi:hypothetical protein EJB05_09164, partial [Eragrostis curvula]